MPLLIAPGTATIWPRLPLHRQRGHTWNAKLHRTRMPSCGHVIPSFWSSHHQAAMQEFLSPQAEDSYFPEKSTLCPIRGIIRKKGFPHMPICYCIMNTMEARVAPFCLPSQSRTEKIEKNKYRQQGRTVATPKGGQRDSKVQHLQYVRHFLQVAAPPTTPFFEECAANTHQENSPETLEQHETHFVLRQKDHASP